MSVPARARAAFFHAEFGRLLAFLAITAALSALWFRDVWTDGVMGLFDWRKDEFFVAYLVASLRE